MSTSYVDAAAAGTLDILDGDLYAGDPYPTYAWLRANAPAYWDEGNQIWAISRYDDVAAIEKNDETFRNGDPRGGYRPKLPPDPSMIGMDDPEHMAHRRLVVHHFTPRSIARREDEVRRLVDQLLDGITEAAARGEPVDVVDALARPLPAMLIGRLLGFPDELWPKLAEWSERTIHAGGGPRYITEDVMIAAGEFYAVCQEIFDQKRAGPDGDEDVMAIWARSRLQIGDEQREYSREDVTHDCLLLLDGGAETTRTVLARGLVALADRPEVWAQLQAGADLRLATEELIRWVTPILNMCRTAQRDVEVGGRTIHEGDQLALLYQSANRDETHFDHADEIDVARDPNRHLAFGLGTHFCLGASLARLEIRLALEGLLQRFASVHRAEAAPTLLPGAFVAGISSAPLAFQPR